MRSGAANLTVGAYPRSEERNRILSPSDSYLYISIGYAYKDQRSQLLSATGSILTPFNDINDKTINEEMATFHNWGSNEPYTSSECVGRCFGTLY